MATPIDQAGLPCGNAIEGYAAGGFDPADGVRDLKALSSCTICDSEAKLRCSICRTWYCNAECRKKDWSHHKTLCGTLKDGFSDDKAPLNNVRAILFPMDDNKPRWVWINLKTLDISVTRALGINTPKPLKKAVNKLAIVDINRSLHHRNIGHGIRRFTAPRARFESPEGHNINKSIFALADVGSLKTYFGSAIFFGFRTYQTPSATKIYYEDASLRDLRMIIEWYYTRPENPFISKRHRLPIKSYSNSEEETFLQPAAKINCTVDQDRLSQLSGGKIDSIESVWVLSKDVLNDRVTSEFAGFAGLPWVAQPCESTFDYVADAGNEINLLHNPGGKVFAPQTKGLFQRWQLDNPEGWVLPAHLTSTYCGSILVTHRDGCVIYASHVIAFCGFVGLCLKDAQPHAVYTTEDENVRRTLITADEVRSAVTRAAFEHFWFTNLYNRVGDMSKHFPSPYNDTNAVESDMVDKEREDRYKMEGGLDRIFLRHT